LSDPAAQSAPSAGLSLGFIAAGFGFLVLPLADAIGKQLGLEGVHALQLSWGRWLANAVLLTPVVLLLYGRRSLRPQSPGLQILRALCLVGATGFFFSAVVLMPLASVTATLFIAPLLVTALSGLLLKESVGPRRWAAVALGFAGMLLIVKPGIGEVNPGSLFALGAACCFATYMLLTRKMAGRNPPLVTAMWMGLIGLVVMSVVVVPVYEPFTLRQWGLVGIMGAILTAGHCLIIWAAERLEASAMAPMPYLEMITSTAVGLILFDEFPEATTWIGCALIVAGGLFVAWRESRLGRPPPQPRRVGR
jgi:drug/metabolite transporter (DMT)-like permease